MKLFLLFSPAMTLLHAGTINPNELNDIYTEAIWFVAVFATMSIISIIVSKRHAKKYAEENPVPEKHLRTAPDEAEDLISVRTESTPVKERVTVLSKLADDGVLTEEEFQVLKQHFSKKS